MADRVAHRGASLAQCSARSAPRPHCQDGARSWGHKTRTGASARRYIRHGASTQKGLLGRGSVFLRVKVRVKVRGRSRPRTENWATDHYTVGLRPHERSHSTRVMGPSFLSRPSSRPRDRVVHSCASKSLNSARRWTRRTRPRGGRRGPRVRPHGVSHNFSVCNCNNAQWDLLLWLCSMEKMIIVIYTGTCVLPIPYGSTE